MKKHFALGLVIGIIAIVCLGAASNLIKDYPHRSTLISTDYFLIDTGTNYQNYTYGSLMSQLFTSPTIANPIVSGTLTISGGTGTNTIGGVNEVTNVNGVTLSWKTNDLIFGDGTTNTVIYLGL